MSWLQKRLYPDEASRDPTIPFLRLVDERIRPEHEVLDMGAGAGALNRYQYKGRIRRMVGADLDPRVASNPLLDEGVVADLSSLPFADNSFDVAFSIYVLEHIADPEKFAREVARVLRPGGHFLALTPNRYHYVPLIASLTPTWFHRWYNARRGRSHADTFPTLYRMNTRRRLTSQMKAAGLEPAVVRTIEVQPNYLTGFAPAFLVGAMYERVVNSSDLFSAFRVNILIDFRKPSS